MHGGESVSPGGAQQKGLKELLHLLEARSALSRGHPLWEPRELNVGFA